MPVNDFDGGTGYLARHGTGYSAAERMRRTRERQRDDEPSGERRTDRSPAIARLCACAEKEGALYYACTHNRSEKNDTPIVVEFEAVVLDAVVNGRDFLYTVFQIGDPDRSRPVIERLFGGAVLKYAERAWAGDRAESIPACDLAVQDDAVVRAHAANSEVIGGRYSTRFRSAFLVRLPISSDRILDVRPAGSEFSLPKIDVSLNDCVPR